MSATIGALIPTFTDFTNLNKAQQREIRKTGDLLAKGGVSLDDYGKNLQMLTKGMALGPETAAAFSREMSSLATAIGVTPQQMAKDFSGVSGSLMKLGSEGPKAFKALALASKATGLEVSKLLQITDKFDTFEGAAEQAGRLNAALGGNFVNAMDLMMETDPVGRLNQIRDAILNTGLTFDDMSYYQRKFYAESAGLENTADLALLLSGDLDALKESSRESSDSILALQERTKAMQSIQEKFKALLMSLIPVFEPLITQLHDLINTLDRDDVVEKISAAFVSLGEAFRWVQKWGEPVLWTLGTLFVGKYALGFILFLKNMGVFGALAPRVAAGLGLANISFLEFAAAVVLVGAGIALAAYGLSFLVKSFGEIGDNAGYAIGGILAFSLGMMGVIVVFAKMAPVVFVATAALIKFGFAVALVGGGIMLAAVGIGYMASSFAGLMKVASADQLMALGGALTLIALSAAGLGSIAPVAGAGMAILVLGFTGLALAMSYMSEELVSLGQFTTSLGALANNTSGLKEVSAEIVAIAAAIKSLPAGRAIELSTAMKSSQISATSATMMQTVRAATPAAAAAATVPKFDVTVVVDGVVTKAVTKVSQKIQSEYLGTGGSLG